ncbi:unnamed protein product [Nippostrongylus brasiliensis]|uniref:SSD domain-containing protein n=1 Tax=Nippostrongylus brasiliensis TaxID=27835 RepID=A0A0N4Y615_NIPBR|nr:unnamed protein product [Nippostrongylus brasiliensis]
MLLAKAFGSLGSAIGSRPLTFFAVSLVVFAVSVVFLAIFPPEVRLGLDKGYTTNDAPSIRESRTQLEFFGSTVGMGTHPQLGKPWYMALFAEPRDEEKGSMLESGEFDEFKDFYKGIKKDIVIRRAGNHSLTYMDYCGKTCRINDQLFKTHSLAFFGFQWPVTSIFSFKSNIGKYFFLRDMKGNDMVRSRLSTLYFVTFVNSTQMEKDMSNFEAKVADLVAEHNLDDSKLTTITQYSALGMQQEIARGMKFVIAKVLAGLEGALVLYSSWILDSRSTNAADQMEKVFAATMPSLTIVSATALGFLLGGLFPIEEFAGLSFYMGVTILFIYAYQMCFFTGVMMWCSPLETHRPMSNDSQPPTAPKTHTKPWFSVLLSRYSHCLSNSTWLKIFALSVFCLCLALPTYIGSSQVKSNIDYQNLLPADSPKKKAVHIMNDVVWNEYFNVMFFIENSPRFDDPAAYGRFRQMISEIESIPGALADSDMMWINDFERHTDMTGNETALNMTLFKDFINHDIYKAWNSGVQYRYEGDRAIVTRMVYMYAFQNVKSMVDKAVLLTKCRQIAARYPEMDVFPFDTDVTMIDVVLQIPYATYFIPLFALVTYAAVCTFLIGNLAVALVSIASAVCVFLESYCISALLGVVLNPFSAAFILASAAISVKFSTYTCYAFQQAEGFEYQRDDARRMRTTLKRTLAPVTLSTIAGSMIFLPVLATNVTIFKWIALINLCCLIGGAFHGLLFSPLLLVWLPRSFTGRRFFCTATKHADDVAMKNLNVL